MKTSCQIKDEAAQIQASVKGKSLSAWKDYTIEEIILKNPIHKDNDVLGATAWFDNGIYEGATNPLVKLVLVQSTYDGVLAITGVQQNGDDIAGYLNSEKLSDLYDEGNENGTANEIAKIWLSLREANK